MKKKYIFGITAVIVVILVLCLVFTKKKPESADEGANQVSDQSVSTISPVTQFPEPQPSQEENEPSLEENQDPAEVFNKSFTDCFSIDLPDGWTMECYDSNFMATLSYQGKETAYFSFITPYTTDAEQIVANTQGSHAYLKSEPVVTKRDDFEESKVVVGFKLSDAESENGETTPDDQIHYYYYYPELEKSATEDHSEMKATDWVGDLYFNSGAVDEKVMDQLAGKLKMTCVD